MQNELGVKDPYSYFQAGVLIYNIKAFNDAEVEKKLFEALTHIAEPILSDQDILNAVCNGHVSYFPTAWNVEWQIPIEFADMAQALPPEHYKLYTEASKDPAIIHYASPAKPWDMPNKLFAAEWWKYARMSSCYEYFLARRYHLTTEKRFEKQQEAIQEMRMGMESLSKLVMAQQQQMTRMMSMWQLLQCERKIRRHYLQAMWKLVFARGRRKEKYKGQVAKLRELLEQCKQSKAEAWYHTWIKTAQENKGA